MTESKILFTRSVNNAVADNSTMAKFVVKSLKRHAQKDWGDLDDDDKEMNDLAIDSGDRIFSAYNLPKKFKKNAFGSFGQTEQKIWVISDPANQQGKREVTTVLFPSEY